MTLNLPELSHALAVVRSAVPQAFAPLQTEADYEAALATLEDLMDAIGPNLEGQEAPHPLEPLAAALTERISAYEESIYTLYTLPQSSPAEALAYCMELRGLTQTALAKATGIDQGNLSKLLSGERPFNAAQIRTLSQFFRVDAALFL